MTIQRLNGTVMRSTGSFYDVLAPNGERHTCRVRGKIRLEGIRETNPVAVGDHVAFDLEHETGSITEILPRTNHILRQSVKKTGHSHVLAANVDQALLVVTLAMPRTSLGFIDRVNFWIRAFVMSPPFSRISARSLLLRMFLIPLPAFESQP